MPAWAAWARCGAAAGRGRGQGRVAGEERIREEAEEEQLLGEAVEKVAHDARGGDGEVVRQPRKGAPYGFQHLQHFSVVFQY